MDRESKGIFSGLSHSNGRSVAASAFHPLIHQEDAGLLLDIFALESRVWPIDDDGDVVWVTNYLLLCFCFEEPDKIGAVCAGR